MSSLVLSAAKDPLRKNAADPSPLKRLRIWGALTMLIAPSIADACPVCFGGPNSIGKGMDAAIFFLLAVVGFVQLGIVALFFSFWRRAREIRRRKESFHVIEGGAR